MHDQQPQQRAGADALIALLRSVDIGTAGSFERADDTDIDNNYDPRDYVQICKAISDSIATNVTHAETQHREGYLRALADLFCMWVDGCAQGLDEMKPIEVTAASFGAAHVLQVSMGRLAS
jgi:hypothetical protein